MDILTPLFKTLSEHDYEIIHKAMLDFTDQRDEHCRDEVWLVEHDPVFTLGRNGNKSNLLQITDIPIVNSDRGGDITYHGPGQLVMYSLIDIKRLNLGVKTLVNGLEEMVINYLAQYSVKGERIPNAPGVYVNNKKLASLGLRVRKGKAFHGIAINVDMDLKPFSHIHPCGLTNMQATQLKDLGIQQAVDEVALSLSELMVEQFYIQAHE